MVSLQVAFAAIALSGVGQTVMLDFYADWCGPCRAMDPTVQELARLGYPVQRVNVDQNRALAAKYRVQSIPCFVMLVDGQEVDREVGGASFARLERMCNFGRARAGRKQAPTQLAQQPAGATPAPPVVSLPQVDSGPSALAGAMPPGAAPPAQAPAAPPAPDLAPPADRSSPLDARLIAVTVRLRIEDADGHSCGSGTIIDARQGEALILTCGHIFRDSRGKGRIEVDLFGPGAAQGIPGNLISYDLARDVGLVSIRTPGPMTAARVAPPGYRVGRGDPVISLGCNHGQAPSARHSQITSVNRYDGQPNVEIAGQSVEGRSGGGLFSSEGLVIGVCNAADPRDNEGLYAALGAIHAEMDRKGLLYLCKAEEGNPMPRPAGSAPRGALVAVDPPPMPQQLPPAAADSGRGLPVRPVAAVADSSAPIRPEEQAALDEIHRRFQDGAEVVCVVRSRRDPTARSEVFMLDKVSPEFLKRLVAQSQPQEPPHLTSLELPRKRSTPEATPVGLPGLSSRAPSGPVSGPPFWSARSAGAAPPARSPAASQSRSDFRLPAPVQWAAGLYGWRR